MLVPYKPRTKNFASNYPIKTSSFSTNNYDQTVDLTTSIEALSDTVKSYQNKMKKSNISSESFDIPEDAFDIIENYKTRLHFISSMTEIESIVKAANDVQDLSERDKYLEEIEDLAKSLKVINDISCLPVNTIKDPETNKVYTSSPSTFKGNLERYLVIINCVSAKFPVYQIKSIDQLTDAARMDSKVKDYVALVRLVLSECQGMPKEMLEAGISRSLYKDFISDNKQLKEVNNHINDVMESTAAVFKSVVESTNKYRLKFLQQKGPVIKVAKTTQDQLPDIIKARIISRGLSRKEQAAHFREALSYYRRIEFYTLSGKTYLGAPNYYFDKNRYEGEDSSIEKVGYVFSPDKPDDKGGPTSTPPSSPNTDLENNGVVKQHSDLEESK